MYAERRTPLLLCALGLAWASPLAAQDEHIFEPGTRHVCVPAASGQGWDCSSAETPPAAAAERPREPRLRSSSEIPDDPAPPAARAAAVEAEPAARVGSLPAQPTAPAQAPASAGPAATRARPATPAKAASQTDANDARSRRIPNYLLAPESRESSSGSPAPRSESAAAEPARPPAAETTANAQVAAGTPAAASSPQSSAQGAASGLSVSAPLAPAPAPSSSTQPAPAAAPPRPAAAPPPAATAASTTSAAASPPESTSRSSAPAPAATTVLRGSAEFRRLGDGRFVLELAGGSDRRAVEDEAGRTALARGDIYLLALSRDGAPWYLAVWGDFDSVDAARAARGEALAAGAARAGWPRRAGPLKQELRGQ